jgi:hypothetical protein
MKKIAKWLQNTKMEKGQGGQDNRIKFLDNRCAFKKTQFVPLKDYGLSSSPKGTPLTSFHSTLPFAARKTTNSAACDRLGKVIF